MVREGSHLPIISVRYSALQQLSSNKFGYTVRPYIFHGSIIPPNYVNKHPQEIIELELSAKNYTTKSLYLS